MGSLQFYRQLLKVLAFLLALVLIVPLWGFIGAWLVERISYTVNGQEGLAFDEGLAVLIVSTALFRIWRNLTVYSSYSLPKKLVYGLFFSRPWDEYIDDLLGSSFSSAVGVALLFLAMGLVFFMIAIVIYGIISMSALTI